MDGVYSYLGKLMVKANEQWSLWDHIGLSRSVSVDKGNKVGPFRLSDDDLVIPRHMNCVNYDFCLTFASNRRWVSFSCEGCRKSYGLAVRRIL